MIFSFKDYVVMAFSIILPPKLKILFYKYILGYKIEKGFKIGFLSAIVADKVYIEKNTGLAHLSIIKCKDLRIGEHTQISMFDLIYGYATISIGKFCYIGEKVTINLDEDVKIGSHSVVGPRCSIYTHGVWLPYSEGNPRKFAPVVIEDNVRIVTNITIQPGVTIGRGSIVGPNSVVVKDIPPEEFVSGIPAKKVKDISEMKDKVDKEELKKRAQHMIDRFKSIFHPKEDIVIFPKEGNTKKHIILYCSDEDAIQKNKGVSWFDFRKKLCKVKTREEKIFREYIWEKYGEWFYDFEG